MQREVAVIKSRFCVWSCPTSMAASESAPLRYILRDLLSQPWLDIREASNGKEVMSCLDESLPDAVILDLLMPDMSGFEILRQLRTRMATENLPVLIYTSKVLSESERAQLEVWKARVIRKEDITTRLSAQPFLDG